MQAARAANDVLRFTLELVALAGLAIWGATATAASKQQKLTNVTLQQQCPYDFVGHLGITLDPVALQWVEKALAGTGPANPRFAPSC